ncbi:hypothetical protein D3C71_1068950 [compost metagenome]
MAHRGQEFGFRSGGAFGRGLGQRQRIGLGARIGDIDPVPAPQQRAIFGVVRQRARTHPAQRAARGGAELHVQRGEVARSAFHGLADTGAVALVDAVHQGAFVGHGFGRGDAEQSFGVTGDIRQRQATIALASALVDDRRQVVGDFSQALLDAPACRHFIAQPPVSPAVHQQGRQQHQRQRHAPARDPAPVQIAAVLGRQPVAADRFVLARAHVDQHAVEGGGQRRVLAFDRQRQSITEPRWRGHVQLRRVPIADDAIHDRQIADVGVSVPVGQPRQGELAAAGRYDARVRRLLQDVPAQAVRVGQQDAAPVQVTHAQHRRAATGGHDHVGHGDEGLAEYPIITEVGGVVGNAHDRVDFATAQLLAGVEPVMRGYMIQLRAQVAQQAQVFGGDAAGLARTVEERQRRRVRCERQPQGCCQHALFGIAENHLRLHRPLRGLQPAPLQALTFALGQRGQSHVQGFGQGLLGIGHTEVQALRRQIAGAQQHHISQPSLGDQGGDHVGIADIHGGVALAQDRQCGGSIGGDHAAGRRKARAHLFAGDELTFGDHAQAAQIGIGRRPRITRPADQRQRRSGIGARVDHAAGAVGGQGDVHHHVDFAAAGRIQHIGPIAVHPHLHLHAQLLRQQAQVVVPQTDRFAIAHGFERRPAAVVHAQDDGRVPPKPLALPGRQGGGAGGGCRHAPRYCEHTQHQPANDVDTHAA